MKKALCVLLTFCPFFVFAQVIISGKVADKKGPLRDVSVTIKDTYDGATSDSSGHYHFTTSEKGNLLLQITAIGYRSAEEKISLNNSSVALNILLKEVLALYFLP